MLNEANEVIGMVSEGDLLWHRLLADPTAHLWRAAGGDSEKRPGTVAEVMSTPPVTFWPQADIADIAESMLHHNVRSVPILDGAFDDDTERTVVTIMARTVPGVAAVRLGR
ncbi:CBS domain-containing protein [Dactylosporangium cerinum]|uniref:CBS domain-containing protein n=1 Tax=Dactylosporangium cerinum TaxID=1434730 RepID=A0ABV9VYB9_9ACTN